AVSNQGVPDAIYVADLSERRRDAEDARAGRRRAGGGLRRLYQGDGRRRRVRRGRPARPRRQRHHGAHRERQDQGVERPLCGSQGTAWRLLSHRMQRSRRGPELGGALPQRPDRRDGGPSRPENVMGGDGDGTRRAVERAARDSYGRLVAYLAARTGDVAGAEDALSEAFAAALAVWQAEGVPRAPEAWLLAVARRKAIDDARRRRTHRDAGDVLHILADEMSERDTAGTDIPDDRLRLMFACAHPAIEEAARAPLILQTVLGLDASAIASAFLVSPATMSQRLVRAKRKIGATKIPFRVPERNELAERLDAVLDAIY